MARIQMRADATKESGDFSPVPDGEYVLACTGVQDKRTQKGRDMVNIELTVEDGEYKGRKLWANITFIPEGEPGHGMMVHALHAFGFPYDGDLDFDTQDFRGRCAKAQVIKTTYTDDKTGDVKPKNEVKNWITENHGSAAPQKADVQSSVADGKTIAPGAPVNIKNSKGEECPF